MGLKQLFIFFAYLHFFCADISVEISNNHHVHKQVRLCFQLQSLPTRAWNETSSGSRLGNGGLGLFHSLHILVLDLPWIRNEIKSRLFGDIMYFISDSSHLDFRRCALSRSNTFSLFKCDPGCPCHVWLFLVYLGLRRPAQCARCYECHQYYVSVISREMKAWHFPLISQVGFYDVYFRL